MGSPSTTSPAAAGRLTGGLQIDPNPAQVPRMGMDKTFPTLLDRRVSACKARVEKRGRLPLPRFSCPWWERDPERFAQGSMDTVY